MHLVYLNHHHLPLLHWLIFHIFLSHNFILLLSTISPFFPSLSTHKINSSSVSSSFASSLIDILSHSSVSSCLFFDIFQCIFALLKSTDSFIFFTAFNFFNLIYLRLLTSFFLSSGCLWYYFSLILVHRVSKPSIICSYVVFL